MYHAQHLQAFAPKRDFFVMHACGTMPRGSDSPGHLGFRWVHFQFDSAASQLLVLTNQQLDDLSCRLFLLLRVPHSVPLVHQP